MSDIFEINDIVEWAGVRGTVAKVTGDSTYPITVDFLENDCDFTSDGRYFDWHTEPSLKLVEKAKKKVKKKIVGWVNVYPTHQSNDYSSKEDADNGQGLDRIACVLVTGEYEIDE